MIVPQANACRRHRRLRLNGRTDIATRRVAKPKTQTITFVLPGEVQAESVALCGEFNDWSSETIIMERVDTGCWQASVALEPGRSYRYKYLIDGVQWENAWESDAYVPNPFGSDDSVVVVA
jgi:1,4-alpha-glucan branching enzyme